MLSLAFPLTNSEESTCSQKVNGGILRNHGKKALDIRSFMVDWLKSFRRCSLIRTYELIDKANITVWWTVACDEVPTQDFLQKKGHITVSCCILSSEAEETVYPLICSFGALGDKC